ncbi:MAG TPA: hypothetical protein VFZ65_06695 [Planctomycetota bacterium]|nr:hypothetical protein [Planctomycetota bacterium]
MDTYDFLADPRAITLQERRATALRLHKEQTSWLERLRLLTEPPSPEQDFPAFLLATQPFADLAQRLLAATSRSELPLAVADELDWFVRAFAGYLRTCDGEDVFSSTDWILSE